MFTNEKEYYLAAEKGKQTAYYVSDEQCAMKRLELGSKRKKMVSIEMTGDLHSPDEVTIKHYTFDMVIELTKLVRDDAQ